MAFNWEKWKMKPKGMERNGKDLKGMKGMERMKIINYIFISWKMEI